MGDHLSEMAILKTQDAVSSDVDVTPLTARMTFIFFVPFFLLGPFAGLLADRLPRRGIMVTADAVRCAVMLGFAGLLGWMQDWGRWGPFLPLLLIGLFAALFSPARSALLPTLIRRDQLARANALISGLGIIATMISVTIGGYLADRYEPVIAFRLDAATYLVSAVFLIFLVLPRAHPTPSTRSAAQMSAGAIADGIRYVRCHLGVRELLAIAAFVWFCGPLVNSVIPAIVRDVYGGTYAQMGAFRAFLGIGFVIGAIAMAALAHALRSEIAITWGLFGISAGIAVFALSVFLHLEPTTLYTIGEVGVVTAGMSAVVV
ncbi:MAG: MFS transporter, partial [Planctomycetes bacterium]|nr:MFS transporter [Planctomycetota bacterium]